jgi:hypothetical protein
MRVCLLFGLACLVPLVVLIMLDGARYIIEQSLLTRQNNRDMRDLRKAVQQCGMGIRQACGDIGSTEQLLKKQGWCH